MGRLGAPAVRLLGANALNTVHVLGVNRNAGIFKERPEILTQITCFELNLFNADRTRLDVDLVVAGNAEELRDNFSEQSVVASAAVQTISGGQGVGNAA